MSAAAAAPSRSAPRSAATAAPLGLTWSERESESAEARAKICGAAQATFEVQDVRGLDERDDFIGQFDIVVCCENIERVIDDFRLMRAMAACLKPCGRLLLTSPFLNRIPINAMDWGPFRDIEDGRHVRRGYNRCMFAEMSAEAGLTVESISFLSGPVSRSLAKIQHDLEDRGLALAAWALVLPFRILPPLLDPLLMRLGATPFTLAMEAVKPRRAPT